MSDLIAFFDECSTEYHFIEYAKQALINAGYVELKERERFPDPMPPKAFVVRDGLSIVAYTVNGYDSIVLTTSECYDFYAKVKENYEYEQNGIYYTRLGLYGGQKPWCNVFDRDLKVAGVVWIKGEGNKIHRKLIDSKRPIAILTHNADEIIGTSFRMDRDDDIHAMIGKKPLKPFIASLCGCAEEDIVNWDLRYIPAQKPDKIGDCLRANNANTLAHCYACLNGFLKKEDGGNGVQVLALHAANIDAILRRDSCGSDSVMRVLKAIFKHKDYECIKEKSFCLYSVPMSHGNGTQGFVCNRKQGVVVRTSVRSNCATEMASCYIMTNMIKKLGVKSQTFCDKNSILTKGTSGSRVESVTGIRTGEVGLVVSYTNAVRATVSAQDIEELTKLVKGMYESYEPVAFSFVE